MSEVPTHQGPRAAARRRQVLDAASICFRRHGFHGASMAQVANEAKMSVGHIYRYFDSKEEIIAAIVRQDVDRILAMIKDMRNEPGDPRAILIARVDQAVEDAADPVRAGLMVEIRAEASRDPDIRRMVRALDLEIEEQLRSFIRGVRGDSLDDADLATRVEMLALIFHGIGLRTVTNPDFDRAALARLVRLVIDAILR